MTSETVDKMLADYKRCVARCEHIQIELEMMDKQLERSRESMMTDEALHSVNYDGMPHGSGVGNPTESLVLKYMSGYEPKYIKEMEEDARKIWDEKCELQYVIRYVDSWLKALTEKELFVISQHVIEKRFWKEILDEYESKWGQLSKEGLRKIKKKALDKIYEAAE